MFHFNLPHTIANMFLFTRTISGRAPVARDLRAAYVEALIDAQGNDLSRSPGLSISFGERPVIRGEAPLLGEYGAVSRVAEDERAHYREQIEKALALLGRLDRRLRDLVELVVTDLLLMRGEKSGAFTVGWQLGVVHLLPDPSWDEVRWADTLLHEAVHANVHLADLVNGIFADRASLASRAALVPSAVRKGAEMRPFEGAFHSACVSVAVAYLRFLLGDGERVAELVTQLGPCVASIAERSRWLTPYGAAVLEPLRAFVAEPDLAAVGATLAEKRFMRCRA